MGPAAHAGIAALTGAAVALCGGVEAGLTAFAAGTLIDADHLIDYVAAEGWHFDLGVMLSGSYFRKASRAYVLLHSYELVVLSSLGCVVSGHPLFALGLAAGALTHLGSDILYYRFTPLAYSTVYRAVHGFGLDAFKRRSPVRGLTRTS